MRLINLIVFSSTLTLLHGCDMGTAGSERAARDHYHQEFQKWIAGDDSEVTTMEYRLGLQLPIGYDIRSVASEEPDSLAYDRSLGLPDNWQDWPAYKLNVAIEWKSEAGTPLEKVTTYRLTWNAHEQKWYVKERF